MTRQIKGLQRIQGQPTVLAIVEDKLSIDQPAWPGGRLARTVEHRTLTHRPPMLARFRLISLYLLFWVSYFETARIIFLLFQWKESARLTLLLDSGILLHGLQMDLAAACALAMVPLCVVSRGAFVPDKVLRNILRFYTSAMLLLTTAIIFSDVEIFTAWGSRLDASALYYLRTPSEAFTYVNPARLLILVTLAILSLFAACALFEHFLLPKFAKFSPVTQTSSLAYVAIGSVALLIGGNGGVDWTTSVAASSVYFSRDHFANQAALNPAWNMFISARLPTDAEIVRPGDGQASSFALVDSLLGKQSGRPKEFTAPKLLRSTPKRIVLIIWESLTAKIVEPLGGVEGVTPNLSKLASQGILFDGIYASGTRTAVGLAAILSGMPSMTKTRAIESSQMVNHIPSISRNLKQAGYRTAMYYGGSLSFDNFRRYFLAGNYDVITEASSFDRKTRGHGGSIPDDEVLQRLLLDMLIEPRQTFSVVLTSSSHQPFDVPMITVIHGTDQQHRFLNSHVYTDRSIGRFIASARRQPWWDSTLIIITADHGNHFPTTPGSFEASPRQYKIPMLWLGGALATRDTVIHRIASQTDIAMTLLSQLGISTREYSLSRNILAPDALSFAYFAYDNGFGYVDSAGSFGVDARSNNIAWKDGNPSRQSIAAGLAFRQTTAATYARLRLPPHH